MFQIRQRRRERERPGDTRPVSAEEVERITRTVEGHLRRQKIDDELVWLRALLETVGNRIGDLEARRASIRSDKT